VVGISKDTVQANAAFADKYQFPFPLLSDPRQKVCNDYGACFEANVQRNTYIIGPDGRILYILHNVNPDEHAMEILSILRVLPNRLGTKKSTDTGMTANTKKGEEEKMNGQNGEEKNDVSYDMEGDVVQEATLNSSSAVSSDSLEQANSVEKSAVSAVESSSRESSPNLDRSITPSQVQPAQNDSNTSLVFALGTLGYDFGTEARRDSILQDMGSDDILPYLEKNQSQAAAIIWTLNLDATPIYAIQPQGAFAGEVYQRLRKFMKEQAEEGVERVSIPGFIFGQVRLMSGQIVPVIWPELRCMYSWTTAALVEAVCGKPPSESADEQKRESYSKKSGAVANFLQRIYNELRNLGITSQERAMNYAAANVANAKNIFEAALEKNLTLHSIEVIPGPICRPGSDCWDVKMIFFDPENILRAKNVYSFTVDVSDVCPVMVGQVRSWTVA
jgi:cyanobactin maturation PatA/PatG family protease